MYADEKIKALNRITQAVKKHYKSVPSENPTVKAIVLNSDSRYLEVQREVQALIQTIIEEAKDE